MSVNKITWERAGWVTEPGRYMYRFGWLTITAGDLDIWRHYPGAAFTLLAERPATEGDAEEYHLGAFDILPTSGAEQTHVSQPAGELATEH